MVSKLAAGVEAGLVNVHVSSGSIVDVGRRVCYLVTEAGRYFDRVVEMSLIESEAL